MSERPTEAPLPCPICGEAPISHAIWDEFDLDRWEIICDDERKNHTVSVVDLTGELATARWNRRASPAPLEDSEPEEPSWPPCNYLSNTGVLHPDAKPPCNGNRCILCSRPAVREGRES
jgi:hypothetical protein